MHGQKPSFVPLMKFRVDYQVMRLRVCENACSGLRLMMNKKLSCRREAARCFFLSFFLSFLFGVVRAPFACQR